MIGYKTQERVRALFFNLLLITASLLAVGPVAWIWVSALKTNKEIRESALGLPQRLNFENYIEAWIGAHFDQYMLNSLLIGLLTAVVVLTTGSLAAFAFARMQFRGNQVIFFLIFAGMTFPVTARIAPLLTWMYRLNLVDTRLGLVLAYAAGSLPFAILMMRSFFRQFPQELEDAARIDGCSNLQFFGRILLPLSTPALFTLGIFTFMGAWNEFLIALLLINQDAIRTLPLGLMAFQGEFTTNYALSFAGINIAAVPVFVVYVLFQRNFIAGITAGSLK
ncbi:carbohydrate ABC transporter permease [Chloroflexi bacterium TSY]|nr:carbohydrate ABC transporter permease [Chloroflexi bacterium TSY]